MKAPRVYLAMGLAAACLSMAAPLASAGKPGRPPPPPPPPEEPPARFWHSFTDNGSAAADASRLYLFGGNGGYQNDWQDWSDLWAFSVADATWTIRAMSSSARPSARHHAGFSCGGGRCVLANGVLVGALKETWVYTEDSDSWSQVNCKRYPCPSARMMPTMAYDSARNYHLLFGGMSGMTNLGDTYVFSDATLRWALQQPSASPPARNWAAATFVAGPVNRVVLFGGLVAYTEILCDMWSWSGTDWEPIEQINWYDGPCLRTHSMAWDGARLVVTGGDVRHDGDTPNEDVWTFEFTPDGKAGTWTYEGGWYSYFQCTGASVTHPLALMAFDRPSGSMVFFGGGENLPGMGAVAYDDRSVCH